MIIIKDQETWSFATCYQGKHLLFYCFNNTQTATVIYKQESREAYGTADKVL